MIDLTLRCLVCGDRADMCFAHGDDWKKRSLPPLYQRTDAQLRAGVNEFTQDDPPPYSEQAVIREPWLAVRWQDASDPPEYAEHNARMRYEAARDEVFKTLIAAIDSAGDAFADLGLDADDAGGWIESAFEISDWVSYFDGNAT